MSFPNEPVMAFALSYPVDVRSVPPKGFNLILKTDANERRKLADSHDLISVDEFSADFHLRPWKKRGLRLQVHIKASIIQKCIITAESVESHIDQPVDVIYVPRGSRFTKSSEYENTQELFLDAEGPDAPEIFEGNEIDIGAVAEEFFELAIDPYPRKQGAFFETDNETSEDNGGEKDAQSPFSVLERLKRP